MRRAIAIGIGLAFAFEAGSARADKFDSTVDIAGTLTTALVQTGGDLPGQWITTGVVDRIALSHHGLRLGASFGFLGVPSPSALGTVWGIPFEIFGGWAFGSARKPQPYLELRGSAIHVFCPTDHGVPSTWVFSLVPRVGVRIPLGEFFFLDFGGGAGFGAERFQLSWGFGLPIPTANL